LAARLSRVVTPASGHFVTLVASFFQQVESLPNEQKLTIDFWLLNFLGDCPLYIWELT
jgi:hypothetical protein